MADAVHAFGVGNGMPDVPNPALTDIECPIILDVVLCVKWYWRVKKWTNANDISVSCSGGTVVTSLNALDFTPTIFGPTRELDLVFSVSSHFEGSVTPAPDGDSIFWLFDVGYRQDIVAYRPALKIAGQITVNDGGGGNSSFLRWDLVSANLPAVTGSITINVDGQPATLYYYSETVGDGAFNISNYDITPSEYWPYAAADTTPIYNTTTGAQLQDPRN